MAEKNEEKDKQIIEKFVESIKDKDLATILFLSIDSNTCGRQREENIDGNYGNDRVSRILKQFQIALKDKNLKSVRSELVQQLLSLTNPEGAISEFPDVDELDGDDDRISETEELTAMFHEILEVHGYPVPQKIKERYRSIIKFRRIKKESKGTYFFVFAENKLLVDVCSKLSPELVKEMYSHMSDLLSCSLKQKDPEKGTLCNIVSECKSQLNEESIKHVSGLKELAFFHIILTFMRKSLLNRLYTQAIKSTLEKVLKNKSKETRKMINPLLARLDQYPIASNPTGLCIIFSNHEDRPGAEKDLEKVKKLFKRYNFRIVEKIDPTFDDVKKLTIQLNSAKYKYYDSLVVFFMGHGDEDSLQVRDGVLHRRYDLIQPFTKMEWFFMKPKLFFIQACANARNDPSSPSGQKDARRVGGREYNRLQQIRPDEWYERWGDLVDYASVNKKADTLVSMATMWHDPAARFEENGSIYIDTLVDQLRKYGTCESIENVLHRVHTNVNSCLITFEDDTSFKQAPYFESSLQKAFIFPETD